MEQALRETPRAGDAVALLAHAYGQHLRRDQRTIEHPLAVGEVLANDGQPPRIVVAGLLHDVLEDTDVQPGELHERFGEEVAHLVEAVTQDDSIAKYRQRKASLRQQILDAGQEAAVVALADKVAKLRSMQERPPDRKLEHYRATLEEIEQRYGPSRLSEQLREQLARWS